MDARMLRHVFDKVQFGLLILVLKFLVDSVVDDAVTPQSIDLRAYVLVSLCAIVDLAPQQFDALLKHIDLPGQPCLLASP